MEKFEPQQGDFRIEGTIVKLNEEQRLVFGWASVIEDGEGNLVKDSQGDVIRAEEMEKMELYWLCKPGAEAKQQKELDQRFQRVLRAE